MRTADEVHSLIRERSTLGPDRTEEIIRKRFEALPGRLVDAMKHWPLDTMKVLDVGCSFGHCLVHFGEGSVGLDNIPEHVEFCRSLGLDARLGDVEQDGVLVDDDGFDAAWVSDVIEHLDSPRLLLRRVAALLKPGGLLVLYLTVLPRSRIARIVFRGRGFFDADVHHYQFTCETGCYLVARAGYEVTEIVPRGLPRPLLPLAPTVFVAARRDAAAEEQAQAAEARNKPRA